ncbi:hypothetical protein L1987_49573 [Smallanthus sonchifolius]|uniref:Uncharacterized protein n=1 Tax=Smallanthus sonchifolius TaxID=185202 RepID=A0ACB9FV45_9ASTR|nr:hypothetical protein L1987_49573 [Smallanthus sonchifolius]
MQKLLYLAFPFGIRNPLMDIAQPSIFSHSCNFIPAEMDVIQSNEEEPKDTYHLAYMIYFLLGAGYLIQWNAFITAVDYFEYLYPTKHINKVFPIGYMSAALTETRMISNIAFVVLVSMVMISGLANGLVTD